MDSFSYFCKQHEKENMKRKITIIIICMVYALCQAQTFTQQPIPDNVFTRMQGKSFGKGCTTKRSDLRYLRISHWDFNGKEQVGEMVCNKKIAEALLDIFRELYKARYPIERMVLIDNYDADDERSMTDNNTSCFNFRFMTGSRTRVSKHGLGLAIDINPLYNPYVSSKGKVSPANGKAYAKNRKWVKGKNPLTHSPLVFIHHGDICHRLFTKYHFSWGGAWKHTKDYQHFEYTR